MISAQTDAGIQEQLIEKYMALPNQVWDDIISQGNKKDKFIFISIIYYCHTL